MNAFFCRAVIFVFFAATGGICGAPLREADVAPEAVWFVHVDFEKFRSSGAGKAFYEVFPELGGTLKRLHEEAGFDVRTHLSGVTIYGTQRTEEGAVVVRHGFSNEKLAAWLKRYAMTDVAGAKPRYALPVGRVVAASPVKTVVAVLPREGVMVLGVDEPGLAKAVARLDGSGKDAGTELLAVFATDAVELSGGAAQDGNGRAAERVVPGVFRANAFVVAGMDVKALGAGRTAGVPGLGAMEKVQVFVSGEGGTVDVLAGVQMRGMGELGGVRELLHAFAIAQRPRFKGLVVKTGEVKKKDATASGPWLVARGSMPVRELIAGLAAERKQLTAALGGEQ